MNSFSFVPEPTLSNYSNIFKPLIKLCNLRGCIGDIENFIIDTNKVLGFPPTDTP